MALIFPRVAIVFTLSNFEYSPIKWKCSVPAFRHYVHVLMSNNCKQSITVWFLLSTRCFKAW